MMRTRRVARFAAGLRSRTHPFATHRCSTWIARCVGSTASAGTEQTESFESSSLGGLEPRSWPRSIRLIQADIGIRSTTVDRLTDDVFVLRAMRLQSPSLIIVAAMHVVTATSAAQTKPELQSVVTLLDSAINARSA